MTATVGTRSRTLNLRRGSALYVLLGILAVAALTVAAIVFFNRRAKVDPSDLPLVKKVTRGPFDHVVLEHGEISSSSNIEVVCEVKSKGGDGTRIIWVIPEGTEVTQGNKLVELDSSALQDERQLQQIAVNQAEALKIAAESLLEQAELAKREYTEGIFVQEEKTILNERLIAEEKLSRSEESAKFSQRLASLGFQTALQLKADLFAVEQARNELELAENKLETLRTITREKMVKGFDSEIIAARAKVKAETDTYGEEAKRLADIEDQISKCVMKAPAAGQVVYANIMSRRGGTEFVVEEGSLVREQQVVIRLPDPKQMAVEATINESRITLVKEGMPVSIRVEAFDDSAMLDGVVTKVNKYAEPGSWFSSQVKEYATVISIESPPKEIRTGMTAEIQILVDHMDDALQVPVQAICEHKAHTFCLVRDGKGWVTREVQMVATNDKTVVIGEGLTEGDEVVLNPRRHPEWLKLPDLPDPPRSKIKKKKKNREPRFPSDVGQNDSRESRMDTVAGSSSTDNQNNTGGGE